MKQMIDFKLYLIGIMLQGIGFFLADKYNKMPVPDKYRKLYTWIGNNPQNWQPHIKNSIKVMDKNHDMYESFTDIFYKKYKIKNKITTFEFVNFWHYPFDYNNVSVCAFSNGSLQKRDSLSNIIEHMKNDGVIAYSKRAWVIFLLGSLFNLLGLFFEYGLITTFLSFIKKIHLFLLK